MRILLLAIRAVQHHEGCPKNLELNDLRLRLEVFGKMLTIYKAISGDDTSINALSQNI